MNQLQGRPVGHVFKPSVGVMPNGQRVCTGYEQCQCGAIRPIGYTTRHSNCDCLLCQPCSVAEGQ